MFGVHIKRGGNLHPVYGKCVDNVPRKGKNGLPEGAGTGVWNTFRMFGNLFVCRGAGWGVCCMCLCECVFMCLVLVMMCFPCQANGG